MKKSTFSLAVHKNYFLELVQKTDHKTLAVWAIDCAQRVLPYFEEKYPEDHRPRQAIETLQAWINTGVFKMAVIRKASLSAHAAGQAVATAHVPIHSIGAAIYALQAIHRATNTTDADVAVAKERNWQHQHLLELGEN